MPKTRIAAAKQVADAFLPTERSAIEAAQRAAECISTMIVERDRARLHPKTGNKVLHHMAHGLTNALAAADAFAEAHEELAKLPGELGLETAVGPDCEPNSPRVAVPALSAANAA